MASLQSKHGYFQNQVTSQKHSKNYHSAITAVPLCVGAYKYGRLDHHFVYVAYKMLSGPAAAREACTAAFKQRTAVIRVSA